MKTQCKTCNHIDNEEEPDFVSKHFYKIRGTFFRASTKAWDDTLVEVTLEACPICGTVRVYDYYLRNNMEK